MTKFPQRKSPRLQGYDYSQAGAYFVTICTKNRHHLFGHVDGDKMCLSDEGDIAYANWQIIPEHYTDVDLDAFVVMPNHIHGILILLGNDTAFKTVLGRVINAYKGAVTARIRKRTDTDMIVWQSRYHDHIIRDEVDLNRLREYVMYNPARWAEDTFYS